MAELLLVVLKLIGLNLANTTLKHVSEQLLKSEPLVKKFKDAVKKVSENLETKYPDILGNDINYFFSNEEIFSELFKILFKKSEISTTKIKESFENSTLPIDFVEEFIRDLKEELLKDKEFDEILSSVEVYENFILISEHISSIVDNTKSTSENISIIKSYLDENLNKNFNYAKFYEDYKKNALTSFSEINFFGLGISSDLRKGRRKTLNEIYVKPNFYIPDSTLKKNNIEFVENQNIFKLNQIFDLKKNLVILGDPGSGKSVLVKFIISSILEKKLRTFKNKNVFDFFPLRIELRKYLILKKSRSLNIVKYLELLLSTEFSIYNITEAKILDILNKKKVLVFFDGLDEIFDVNEKNDIKNDIEHFYNIFPNTLIVVTSRKNGYEDAKLNKHFKEIHILEFDDDLVEEYSFKWYKAEESNAEIRKTEIQKFLELKKEIDEELIYNPLFLSLIIILFRNNLKIPESKLEIYKSCTKTLVDIWDDSKELKFKLDDRIKSNKEIIFSDLAFWKYEQNSKEEGRVTYSQALKTVQKTITSKLKLDIKEDVAIKLSEEFLDYAEKRSLYFDNDFTHKTFLEYFTAYWIYTNYDKKGKFEERNLIVSKYINNSYWFVVFELLINFIEEDQPDNEVLDEFVLYHLKDKKSLPFLLSVLSSLNRISPSTIKQVLKDSICTCIEDLSYSNSHGGKHELYTYIQRLRVIEKFHQIIQDLIDNLYDEYKENTELFTRYYRFIIESRHSPSFEDRDKYNKNPLKLNKITKIDLYHLKKINRLNFLSVEENLRISPVPTLLTIEDVKEYINAFGVDSMFKSQEFLYVNVYYSSLMHIILRMLFAENNLKYVEDYLDKLNDMGITFNDIVEKIAKRHKLYLIPENLQNYLKQILEFKKKEYIYLALYLFVESYEYRHVKKSIEENKDQILKLNNKSQNIIVLENFIRWLPQRNLNNLLLNELKKVKEGSN